MTRVLLIGNGAREHAIAAALRRSGVEIVARMKMLNPGIASLSSEVSIGRLSDVDDFPDLSKIDFAVVGPEQPLSEAVVDALEKHEIPCVGPLQAAARIETSKVFARELLSQAAPEANPDYVIIRDRDDIGPAIRQVGLKNVVVKPDGLTGGKGVKIFGEHLDTEGAVRDYAQSLLIKEGVLLIEEKLVGIEFTVQTFVDGERVVPMPLVRDYKRAYDEDRGPNTGSMGSYSQEDHHLSYLDRRDVESALRTMTRAIRMLRERHGVEYRGILYGQFIKTSNGVKVLEFNARFGDPEAMNVLALLETPADSLFWSLLYGNVMTPEFRRLATVCVYVVPEGYPGPDVARDARIVVPSTNDAQIYYASVYEQDGAVYTTGSRAVAVLAMGHSVPEARETAYRVVRGVRGRVRFRTDIGKDVPGSGEADGC